MPSRVPCMATTPSCWNVCPGLCLSGTKFDVMFTSGKSLNRVSYTGKES